MFLVNGLQRQELPRVENARRQALAAANDLIRAYSMLDIKLNRALLDNIMMLGPPPRGRTRWKPRAAAR